MPADQTSSPAARTYGAELHLPPYGQLLARQLVRDADPKAVPTVERHFLRDLISHALRAIPVDEAWYLQAYPDVKAAIQAGNVPSAGEHYRRFGYFEHRMPRRITVDEAWYLEAHPDVREAVRRRVYASGQAHFDAAGFREGRLPRAGFDFANFGARNA